MPEKEPKKITVSSNSELATILADAEATGEPVLVDTGDTIYPLYIGAISKPGRKTQRDKPLLAPEQKEQAAEKTWDSYDPVKVREALRRSAGALAGVDHEALLADIYNQREQDTPGRPASA